MFGVPTVAKKFKKKAPAKKVPIRTPKGTAKKTKKTGTKKAVKAAPAKAKETKKKLARKSPAKKAVKRKSAEALPILPAEEQTSQDEHPFLRRSD